MIKIKGYKVDKTKQNKQKEKMYENREMKKPLLGHIDLRNTKKYNAVKKIK